MKSIDRFLNGITMYRLVFYGLLLMAVYAIVLGFAGVLSFGGLHLLLSLALLIAVCGIVNWFFSILLKAPMNTESFMITGLILFFIMLPASNAHDALILLIAGAVAMASKYILAIKRKHLFNPAAVAAVLLGVFGIGNAFWWVATWPMLPVTLIVGLLLVRKINRFSMFLVFLAVSSVIIAYQNGSLGVLYTSWPILFFGTIMLTEPLTTPPTRRLQMIYAGIVAVLFSVQFHIGPFYSSPELALVLGNIFSYIVSSKQKLRMRYVSMHPIASNQYEFIFAPDERLRFTSGQYMEWTLPRWGGDIRGNRRYFTIASSPGESDVRIGVRVTPGGSSFKKSLMSLKTGDTLIASGVTGEFTLPPDTSTGLVFIAGGIGITPFVSMIRSMLAAKQRRDVTLFYSTVSEGEQAYSDVLDTAVHEINLKLVRVVTGTSGYITAEMVSRQVPDWSKRLFYLSGPDSMVNNYEQLLKTLGLQGTRIRKDYFPGY